MPIVETSGTFYGIDVSGKIYFLLHLHEVSHDVCYQHR